MTMSASDIFTNQSLPPMGVKDPSPQLRGDTPQISVMFSFFKVF